MANVVDILIRASDNASRVIDKVGRSLGDTTQTSGWLKRSWEELKNTAPGLNSALIAMTNPITLITSGVGLFAKTMRESIQDTVDYAMNVKDVAMMLGTTTEEASKLIQIGDDLRISQEQMSMAFRFALDKGISPTVDGLADLSEKMMELEDPTERMQMAIDVFGSRAGEQMMRILEQGPDAIRAMSDELEGSALIMGKDAVDAADAYRLALDELNDKVEGVKVSVGTKLITSLVDLGNTWDNLTGIHKGWETAVERLDYLLAEGAISVEEYNEAYRKMNRNFTEEQIPTMAEVSRKYFELKEAQDAWVAAQNMAYPEEERFVQMLRDLEGASGDAAVAATDLQLAMETTSGEFDEAKITAGLLGDAVKSVSDNMIEQQKLTLELADAMGTLTDEEIAERAVALQRIENLYELNRALDDGTLSWEGYTRILEDGTITQQEVIDMLGAEKAALYNIRDAADAAAGNYRLDFEVNVYGDPIPNLGGGGAGGGIYPMTEAATGADFIVPPGFNHDDFIVGTTSGERVIVIPKSEQSQESNITNNNFSMNVHTNAGTSTLTRDFAMLKAWAG